WGQTGNGSGEFIVPLGIEIDGDGNIYVADTINNRVQRFTPNGLSMPGWEDSYMILTYPNDLAIYGDRAYVLEGDSHRVRSFTLDGAPIGQWGSFGTTEGGHLNAPYGIATDSYGYVYVADTLNNRIQKFTPDGGYLAQFGNDGGPAQLSAPRRLEVA